MNTSENISDCQSIAFGNSENGRLWRFQNTDNQYRYSHKITPNSTGKELDAETGYSYFGARYLEHTLTTAWLSVDPMADKYPSISPYAYCAWNPMKLVDPDGKEIWIKTDVYNPDAPRVKWTANGLFNEDGSKYTGNNEFVQQAAISLDAIYSDENARFLLTEFIGETEYDINLYEWSTTKYWEMKSTIPGNECLLKNQSISFNPTEGLAQCKPEAEFEEYLAPFLSLLHEFGHVYNAVTDYKSYHDRLNVQDDYYSNQEEKYVIENYEHPAAAKKGMLQRTSHIINVLGLSITKTSGPLSSTPE